jgi:hypothetical protein
LTFRLKCGIFFYIRWHCFCGRTFPGAGLLELKRKKHDGAAWDNHIGAVSAMLLEFFAESAVRQAPVHIPEHIA